MNGIRGHLWHGTWPGGPFVLRGEQVWHWSLHYNTWPYLRPGRISVAIIASTELKRERVNNLIQVITDSVGHPAHHHELVRHGVHVVHLELGDPRVQAGVEEVHEVNELQCNVVMIQIVLFRHQHQCWVPHWPTGSRVLSSKKALPVWGELRLIEAIKSNWGDSNSWVNLSAVMYWGSGVTAIMIGPRVATQTPTLRSCIMFPVCLTSLAVQSDTSSLNPIMSPKKIVTHSKWSANVEVSPA